MVITLPSTMPNGHKRVINPSTVTIQMTEVGNSEWLHIYLLVHSA